MDLEKAAEYIELIYCNRRTTGRKRVSIDVSGLLQLSCRVTYDAWMENNPAAVRFLRLFSVRERF